MNRNPTAHREQSFEEISMRRMSPRKRRMSWLTSIVVMLSCSLHARAGERDLDNFIADEMQRWAIPGLAVAVVRGDRVEFSKGYGLRQIDRAERVDEHTTFGIGSVTKSFTATGAAMLVDEGKLAWEALAIDYMPTLHFFDPWITAHASVLDLASHRLGIDESAIYMVRGGNIDQTARAVRYMRPVVPFRTFLYSNTGYALLGKAVADTSGMSWDDFIATRIFKPLGMNDSYPAEHSFIDADRIASCWLCEPPAGTPLGREALRNRGANMAVPHGLTESANPKADAKSRVTTLPWRSERTVAPTGLIHSSAYDMAQWMLLHLGHGEYHSQRLVSAEQIKQIHTAHALVPESDSAPVPGFRLEGYGMGWFVGTYRGRPASQHGGGRVGYGSQVWLFPEEKLGVVVLQNLDYREGPPLSHIAMRLADHYLGIPHEHDVATDARAAEPRVMGARASACASSSTDSAAQVLSRYAGSYHNDVLGEARIAIDGDHPVLSFEPGAIADLRARSVANFVMCFRGHEQQPAPLTFTLDAEGAPVGFTVGTVDPDNPSNLSFKRVR
jgi:CubicO group peptidase (beta-lactamase class C family)